MKISKEIIFTAVTAVAAGVSGFFVGKKVLEKNLDRKYAEKLDREASQIHATDDDYISKADAEKIANIKADNAYKTGFDDGRNEQYKIDYRTILKEAGYSDEKIEKDLRSTETIPPEEDPDNPDNNFEMEDGTKVTITSEPVHYKYKSNKTPKILKVDDVGDPIDESDPDTKFDEQELNFYIPSNILVDEFGHMMEEKDTLGSKPRSYGYLSSKGKIDDFWVRNYDHEMDYHVFLEDRPIEEDFDIRTEE